jgi:hypothetical protein
MDSVQIEDGQGWTASKLRTVIFRQTLQFGYYSIREIKCNGRDKMDGGVMIIRRGLPVVELRWNEDYQRSS